MTIAKLLFAEIRHRFGHFAMGLVAVGTAAALFTAAPTIIAGYSRDTSARVAQQERQAADRLAAMKNETEHHLKRMQEEAAQAIADVEKRTVRIMRDLGFNLRIVHRDTDTTQLLANFVALDMPEEYIVRIAQSPQITKVAHLVATLKHMFQHEGQPRLLVGIAPETPQAHVEMKSPMGFQIERGTVYLGQEAGRGRAEGDEIEVLGRKFRVARILPAHGTRDEDIAIFMHLKDAQELLDRPGRITEIIALGCKCETVERVEEIQAQLEAVLPETKVMELRAQAIAREDQRKLVAEYHRAALARYQADREAILAREAAGQTKIIDDLRATRGDVERTMTALASMATPAVVLVCGVWIGVLAWSNVRERRIEIGLLRALGKGAAHIAGLFLGKAVLLGLIGGLAGCAIGCALASWVSLGALRVAAGNFAPAYDVLAVAILGAPLVAALASYLPTLLAIRQDPSVVLSDE
jgi:putative ABC transport system permease protein